MSDRALVVVTRVATVWKSRSPSEEWVAERLAMMERINIPAMQSVRSPVWWVWRTAKNRFDQVREAADRIYPQAIVVTNDSTHDAVAPDHDRFLTFRVDSDDTWIPAELDRWANRRIPDDTIVNFAYGWQLDWSTGNVGNFQWLAPEKQGPFLALTHEGRERMLGVGGNHATEARESRANVEHVRQRSWVQVVHGGNIRNHWKAHAPLSDELRATVLDRSKIRLP